ncbi:sialidase family protein [Fimbriiglobus ruber]|uniref:Glycosyl hydrolase, BNR repeat n=1 Tax=Fimbriiglobus ruber TaxID=1908690 RepID=A0A225DPP3_9BACT|nr:hypothetical protein [Fimbriiglobus ruber]OWK40568.1 hypothetical protein FRUB_05487 [Fimbriiglobus ruber]
MRSLLLTAFFVVSIPAAGAAEWEAITTELLKTEKPGYGGLSGVTVDHATGHVFVDVSDRGVFRSTDQGKTWARVGESPIKGRTETPGCLQLDPTGKSKRLMMATVYGVPLALGTTDGAWRFLDKASVHIDWAAVDWSDPETKFILGLKHESGGVLIRSRDGGKTFAEVGPGYGPAWVFDADTAVATRAKSKTQPAGGLVRTTDGGKTFTSVANYTPVSLPRWHDDSLYWLADGALIKSTDRGATWAKVCDLKDGRCGPVFGKDAKHLIVLTGAGIVESTDGGTTWTKPLPIPPALKGVSPLTWVEYDPIGDSLYVMKMTSELYKLTRGGGK